MKHYPPKRTQRWRYSARRDPKTTLSFALLPAEVAEAEKLIAGGVC